MNAIEKDREQFILHVIRFWDRLSEKNGASLANRETAVAEKILRKWDQAEFLLPMLSHNSERVRCAAAKFLLDNGAPEKAILTLRELLASSNSLIAPSIKLTFLKRGIPF